MMGLSKVEYDVIRMQGGLDLVTPTLSMRSGNLRSSYNFEIAINGGYSLIGGYERYDGRPSPSDALYRILPVTFITTVAVGSTVTGAVTGATGVIAAQDTGIIVIAKKTGNFSSSEGLTVLGVPVATMTGDPYMSTTPRTHAIYSANAADIVRLDILAPTGSGAIRGVFRYNSIVYCWRDNAGATACNLWKATTSGWTQVTFGKSLSFTAATAQINDGDTVTGGTSGATGVVGRAVLQSGTWTAAGAGKLILTSTTGTFQAAEALKVGGVSKATGSGAATQITRAAGGRYEHVIANFGGSTATLKVYGCDGVAKGFEFDGTNLVPIDTGMTTDTPNMVIAHKNYLFFSFGASLQFSAVSNPYSWSVILGAGEIGLGDTITGLLTQPGDSTGSTLSIYTINNTFMLYGSTFGSGGDAKLTPFNTGAGARAYTCQNMVNSYALDQRGVLGLATTLNYGNFEATTLSHLIWPLVRDHGPYAVASSVSREKSQYRVFFSDGFGLYITIVNGKVLGCMPVIFPDAVTCIWTDTDSTGRETSWFGTSSGYVMQLEKGTSFDGANILAYMQLMYNPMKSPRILKKFRRASLEMQGNGYAEFDFGYLLGYSRGDASNSSTTTYANALQQASWDVDYWDYAQWDANVVEPTEVELAGTSENIALYLRVNSPYWSSFTLNSAILHYSPRRGLR